MVVVTCGWHMSESASASSSLAVSESSPIFLRGWCRFQPFVGRSTRADARADFARQTPPCDGTVLGWQPPPPRPR
jgi:hypothetical protein